MIRPEILTAIRKQLRAVSRVKHVRVGDTMQNIDAIADDALYVFNMMEDEIERLKEERAIASESEVA